MYDRIVGTCALYGLGRMHLNANVGSVLSSSIHSLGPNISTRPAANGASSFASVLKGNPNTFNHIASSPAMVLDDECVVKRDLDNFFMGETKLEDNILEKFKIIVRGKNFVIRAKELFVWSSTFNDNKEVDDYSEDDSVNGAEEINGDIIFLFPLDFTPGERIPLLDARWGQVEYTISEAVGNSGGILCVWDPSVFRKEHHIVSNNFVALYGSCVSNQAKLLVVSIYAPQSITSKRSLWSTFSSLSAVGDGHCMVHGDFYMKLDAWWIVWVQCTMRKMVRFKKKLQILKKEIRSWVNDCKKNQSGRLVDLRSKLCHIDKVIDQGGVNDDILLTRLDLLKKIHDIKSSDARDYMQKAKIQWAIEGDENSNFFHGIINRKRANLAIKGVMVDGEWVDDPCRVKEEFRLHFANRFRAPAANRCKLNYTFPNRLSSDQLDMLESPISRDEVRNAVWGCGENKSPGPDGFTFEFFRKFWDTLGSDFCAAVEWFFDHSSFSRGCNSSFIALIPKNHDPKFVNDYRPISLIGSLYKVVTKILATRLSSIISGLISDVQTAFLPNRQILDGPFIINELLSWCKHKKQQAMVFKVDFAKAYDSIRWDFLEDVLRAFGFGSKWCSWIRGCLHSGMASVLLNGSPTSEFQFHCGLKQGDPLAPYLFILIMESLHLSLSRAIEAGIFKGIKIGSSLNISHLFYADDAVFIGEWSIANLSGITHILHCFSLLSGLSINLKKSHLLGVGIRSEDVNAAALYFGCSTMKTPFKYLGVMVGGNSSTFQAWDDTIGKLKARLSNWKLKTLSVGGRLTLLKSVLGSTPIYNMSIYKAKVLASKKYGGLGVSSFYALNRALLFKWVWRFISRDNSLWCRLIMSMHGSSLDKLSLFRYSTWKSIIREVHMLKDRVWIGDTQLRVMFPQIYALEINKDCTVADKLQFSVTSSLRRSVRGGVESSQLALLQTYIEGTLLSNMEDRWVWDLNGEGVFRVKDVRILLDECFLPKAPTATRWVKYVPIKINVFAWKVFLDRLPTRSNLQHRGVLVSDLLCPLCSSAQEDSSHLFFSCRLATDIVRLVCRWWNLSWTPLGSYADWLNWFNSIRLSSKVKDLLEGVLYITWWSIWMFRNQLLFSSKAPRKDVIFDDIVSRSFTWCLSRSLMKCTSAIRQLAYICVPDSLDEYMQMGATIARKCLEIFCKVIMNLYGEEFLRKPMYTDIEKLYAYHNEKHGFPGMLRSIDCTNWPWANCPVAFKA
ncbi:RNA-directed DNA polymerase, eukaryota [Tanacetum coccineum]